MPLDTLFKTRGLLFADIFQRHARLFGDFLTIAFLGTIGNLRQHVQGAAALFVDVPQEQNDENVVHLAVVDHVRWDPKAGEIAALDLVAHLVDGRDDVDLADLAGRLAIHREYQVDDVGEAAVYVVAGERLGQPAESVLLARLLLLVDLFAQRERRRVVEAEVLKQLVEVQPVLPAGLHVRVHPPPPRVGPVDVARLQRLEVRHEALEAADGGCVRAARLGSGDELVHLEHLILHEVAQHVPGNLDAQLIGQFLHVIRLEEAHDGGGNLDAEHRDVVSYAFHQPTRGVVLR